MSDKSNAATPEERPQAFIGETLRVILYALLIALTFRTLVFQPFTIPSGSMRPTLLVGDYLLVSKYSFGYSRYSLPFASYMPTWLSGRVIGSSPERGDVVVFRNPKKPGKDYIKRIIGLPGDTIKIVHGQLFINNEAMKTVLPENPSEACVNSGEGGHDCVHAVETLDNGVVHDILRARNMEHRYADNTCAYTVPAGHYFFLGDNRHNSSDSRFGHSRGAYIYCLTGDRYRISRLASDGPGFVPEDYLVGRADIVILSSSKAFWEFWGWRRDRFFKLIR